MQNRVILSFVFIFFLFTHFKSLSQVDTNYIVSYPYNFSLKFYVSNKFTTLLDDYMLESKTYEPNKPPGLGIGFSWGKIGLSVGYGFDFMKDSEKGNTKSIDFQYHYYGRKFLFDFFGQKYQGFYIDNSDFDRQMYDIYKDLKIVKIGAFSQYVFNSKRFSYIAAFGQRERQIKSAGSFLLGGGVYYTEIHSAGISFFDSVGIDKRTNFLLGPSIGYAHTFIMQRFFISMSVSAGLNIELQNLGDGRAITPTSFPRGAMGYNANSWSISISYENNMIYAFFTRDRKIALNTGRAKLAFVKRFRLKSNLPERLPFYNYL